MTTPPRPIDDLSALEQARIDIEALKLLSRLLVGTVAAVAGKDTEESQQVIKVIQSISEQEISNANFSNPVRAEIWRVGMRKTIGELIDPFLA